MYRMQDGGPGEKESSDTRRGGGRGLLGIRDEEGVGWGVEEIQFLSLSPVLGDQHDRQKNCIAIEITRGK